MRKEIGAEQSNRVEEIIQKMMSQPSTNGSPDDYKLALSLEDQLRKEIGLSARKERFGTEFEPGFTTCPLCHGGGEVPNDPS